MSASEDIQRGERAALILSDDLVVGAFKAIEDNILHEWMNSPARDTEGREKLWIMRKTMDRFRAEFESHVSSGKLARANEDFKRGQQAANR